MSARLKHRDELIAKLSAITAKMKRDDLLEKLEAQQVPAGPINNLEQVFNDPQVKHRGMKLALPSKAAKGGTIPGVRTPIVIDGWKAASEHPSPLLGRTHGGNSCARSAKANSRTARSPLDCGWLKAEHWVNAGVLSLPASGRRP